MAKIINLDEHQHKCGMTVGQFRAMRGYARFKESQWRQRQEAAKQRPSGQLSLNLSRTNQTD